MHLGAGQAAHGVTNTPRQYRGMGGKASSQGYAIAVWRRQPREAGLLSISLWLCHPSVTFFSLLSSSTFVFSLQENPEG